MKKIFQHFLLYTVRDGLLCLCFISLAGPFVSVLILRWPHFDVSLFLKNVNEQLAPISFISNIFVGFFSFGVFHYRKACEKIKKIEKTKPRQ